MSKFRLTKEGEAYLKNGLPEENLIKFLSSPIAIGEVKNKIENFNIALQWAKTKGWVKIEGGKIIPIKKPASYTERESLGRIHEGKNVSHSDLQMLLKRNLIEELKETLKVKAQKMVGKEVTSITEELIKTGYWKETKLKPYNIEAIGSKIYPGKRHPYSQFISQIRRKLLELGFKELYGPTVELEFWNFDALFQAQNHPARDWASSYSMKNPQYGSLPPKRVVDAVKAAHENGGLTGSKGWGYKWEPKTASRLMPRAHDTAIQPRFMSGVSGKIEVPGKYFAIARCYRPDIIDATHGVEFNQFGGCVIDESINFRHVLGTLKHLVNEITGAEKVKFLPDYFPFTEPSVQISAKHPQMGWVEFAGAGLYRPEFTQTLGIKEPVVGWGFGIDRLAMFRLGINDIRHLFSQDLGWLRNQKAVI